MFVFLDKPYGEKIKKKYFFLDVKKKLLQLLLVILPLEVNSWILFQLQIKFFYEMCDELNQMEICLILPSNHLKYPKESEIYIILSRGLF